MRAHEWVRERESNSCAASLHGADWTTVKPRLPRYSHETYLTTLIRYEQPFILPSRLSMHVTGAQCRNACSNVSSNGPSDFETMTEKCIPSSSIRFGKWLSNESRLNASSNSPEPIWWLVPHRPIHQARFHNRISLTPKVFTQSMILFIIQDLNWAKCLTSVAMLPGEERRCVPWWERCRESFSCDVWDNAVGESRGGVDAPPRVLVRVLERMLVIN